MTLHCARVFEIGPHVSLAAERGHGWISWRWIWEPEEGAVLMSRCFGDMVSALRDMQEFLEGPHEWQD